MLKLFLLIVKILFCVQHEMKFSKITQQILYITLVKLSNQVYVLSLYPHTTGNYKFILFRKFIL